MGLVIDFDLSTVLAFTLLYVGTVVFLRLKKRKTFAYLLFFTIFFVYMVKVIEYTQFPIYLSETMRANIGQNVWKNMNLIPLITLGYVSLKTSLLNILVTIPFGFGLPFISRFRMSKVVLVGILTSIALETLQMVTAFGARFTFRIVDINDVIFNTLGVALGYILFVWFIYVVRFILNRWHIEQNVILRYIYERPQISGGHINIYPANGEKSI